MNHGQNLEIHNYEKKLMVQKLVHASNGNKSMPKTSIPQ